MGAGARRTFVLTTIAAALNVAAQAQAQNFRNYECQGGAHFEALVVPGANSIYVQLDGKSLQLPRFASVTGDRFRRGDVTIWLKGNRATLRRAGKRIECRLR